MKFYCHLLASIILTLCLTNSINLKAQSFSPIVFDKLQSEYFGAYNLLTIHKAHIRFEDIQIPDTFFNENKFMTKTAGVGYRLAKIFFLDAQMDHLISLTQHEVFGHGARFREFGYEKNSYNLNLFWPFGNGSGFAERGNLKPGYSTPTRQESITINIGGVESEKLLADNLSSHILLDDTMHYRQGLLYLFSQNNLFFYLWITRYTKPECISPGNDMVNYINTMNFTYSNSIDEVYNIKQLSNQSLISLINPLQIYSAFSILYTYGFKGENHVNKIPMIRFGNIKYLPALNYSLAPFGSQFHFINYFRYRKTLFSGEYILGESTYNKFYGISIKGFNVINKRNFTLNFHFDIWNQPELELEKYTKPIAENKSGEAIKIDLMYHPLNRQNRLSLFLQTGYKSNGYLIGEPLAESFILRYGLSLHL